MEVTGQGNNGIDKGGTATPQRDVSVGRWEAEIGMAEVTEKRGKLWGSMGVIRNSKLYCHVEEAVYMVEQGSLLLLRDDGDTAMSRQEVYDLLVVPSNGCSWDAYQIFCHLKRLGYIVGRHGVPWSTSRAKGRPREASLLLEAGEALEPKEEILASANLGSKSGEMIVDECTNCQRSVATRLEAVQTELSPDVEDCENVDEEPLKHDKNVKKDDETSFSGSDKERRVEENRQSLPFLFSNLQLADEDRDMGLTAKGERGGFTIVFDVHHPNGRFKKTAPGFPSFTLCVVSGQQPPEQRQVRALEATIGGIPLKFGTVDCGHVSIFSFTTCSLPTLP